MIDPPTYHLDVFGNFVAPVNQRSVPRSLPRRQGFRLGSEPTLASSYDPINQFQLAPPPPPSALEPHFHHNASTTIPRIPSFLDFRELIWAQPEPIWNVQWSASSVPRSSHDSEENTEEMFGWNNYVLDNHLSTSPQTPLSPSWFRDNDHFELDSPPPPTPPPTPTFVVNKPLAAIPGDMGFFQCEELWGTIPSFPCTPPISKNIRHANEHSKSHGPLAFSISSTPTPVGKDVGVVHTGSFNIETGVTVTPLATGSNNKENHNADTEVFGPTGEAKNQNTTPSNQVSLAAYPSSGYTIVEREPVTTEPHHGGSYIEPVASHATVKGPGRGYRSDLKRDLRLSDFVPFVPEYEQSEVDESEVQGPKISSSKRKMDDDISTISPPPSSKRQRQGKKAKAPPAFNLEEYAYKEHILLNRTLFHSPIPVADSISSSIASSAIGKGNSFQMEHHQCSHCREGLAITPTLATDNLHGQPNLQDGRCSSL